MKRIVLIIGTTSIGSLENSYARGFQSLDWDVHFWHPLDALHKVVRGGRLGRLFSTFVNVEPWLRKANLELLNIAEKLRPQLILVIWSEGVRAGTLAQLKVLLPSTQVYCVFPDYPHNLVTDRILALPFFDRVAPVSPSWEEAFKLLGARQVQYLPLAADTEMHKPARNDGNTFANAAHDVVFVGNWRPAREAFLEQLTEFDLFIWGTDYWKRRVRADSPLKSRWGGRPLFGNEFAQVCGESRILLNIIDVGWPGPNMRAFEQPACCAFSLVTRTPAVLEIFTEGVNIECFDSAEEARDKIRYYLAHEDERRKIAEASYKLVVEGGHTYLNRAQQLIDWVDEKSVTA
jgi:spore maturation protein CgeB